MDVQGGLGQISARSTNVPSGSVDSTAANIQEPTNELPKQEAVSATDQLAIQQAKLDAQIARIQSSLENRKSSFIDPALAKLAAGFLAPTRTGSFGESLASGVSGYTDEVQRQQDAELKRQQMGLELQKSMTDMAKQKALQEASSKMYTVTKDETGAERVAFNPEAAKMMAQLTGDPKYSLEIFNQAKQQKLLDAQNKMFIKEVVPGEDGKPAREAYHVNPQALQDIFKIGGAEETAKVAKSIVDMRKLGLFADKSTEATPFDALLLTAPTEGIRLEAQRLANQYKNGLFAGEEDKAEALAQKYMTLATQHMFDVRDRDFKENTVKFQQMMAQMQYDLNNDIKRAELDRKLKEDAAKLTPEQASTLKYKVQPILDEGRKAVGALNNVDRLAEQIELAPETIAGNIVNMVPGVSNKRDAIKNIENITAGMITTMPRLPGSQSNLDARNLEKNIGKLADPTLSKQDRRVLLESVRRGLEYSLTEAERVENEWKTNKTYSLPKYEKQQTTPNEKTTAPALQNITPEDIKATAKKYGITEEEVKKRLGVK